MVMLEKKEIFVITAHMQKKLGMKSFFFFMAIVKGAIGNTAQSRTVIKNVINNIIERYGYVSCWNIEFKSFLSFPFITQKVCYRHFP